LRHEEIPMKKCVRHIVSLCLLFTMLVATTIVHAKIINLYEQPKADSKQIGSIDSAVGMISIFTTSDGNWIKVGDPRNGNVGWIKSVDLNGKNINFNLIKMGDDNHQYQVIQYGNAKPLTSAQMSNTMKQMELREQEIQKNMQKMMQDMFSIHQNWMHTPMFIPVFIMPEQGYPTSPQEANKQAKHSS
jgi:hypothetical protein